MRPIYKTLFAISAALIVIAAVFLSLWGLRLGVDFKGGSVMEVMFPKGSVESSEAIKVLQGTNIPALKDATANSAGNNALIIKSGTLTEDEHQKALAVLKVIAPNKEIQEKRFDSVGPLISSELKKDSITAIVIVLLAISIYIALVFRKLRGLLPMWVMALAVIGALIHDLIIPMGVFAWLGYVKGVEINAIFVAALLTVLGYSISDTVVVFDRVRENLIKIGSREPLGEVVHKSVMQTLVRSLNTNLTTLLSLVAIYVFGGESVRYFALALIIGIFLGAFSSISVASPILVWGARKRRA
ncbi:MAG: protein translocase subunit SecF [Candidatus Yanofskybacteria bacterium]|nr:protein translocase subunit SecF [Candidatus Yanofskybacteria bacterium]